MTIAGTKPPSAAERRQQQMALVAEAQAIVRRYPDALRPLAFAHGDFSNPSALVLISDHVRATFERSGVDADEVVAALRNGEDPLAFVHRVLGVDVFKGFAEIGGMVGRTMTAVTGAVGDADMRFISDDGVLFHFTHHQDCCESVSIEQIDGEIEDLVGSPIVMAEEVSSEGTPPAGDMEYAPESYTWTFYKFATNKGYVTVRWYGTSNGYYSEGVSLDVWRAR